MPLPRVPPANATIRPYPLGRLVLATAALIVILIGATVAVLLVSYRDTLRQETTNLRNLSIAFAAQTFSVAQGVDNVMLQAEHAYAKSPGQTVPNPLLNFADNPMAEEYLLGIYLYDEDGKLIANAVTNKRTMVPAPAPAPAQIHKVIASHKNALQITITNIDPVTGRGIVNFSRPTVDGAGVRTGIIVAQADSERFERIYSLVELGKGGSVTMFNRNGTMLVRGPNFPNGIGQYFIDTPLFARHLPAGDRGAFATVSPIDGRPRLYGYDAVSGYPLVIITGMDQSDALASWYGRVWTALISLLLVSSMVVFLGWRVARDAARKFMLIGQLAASEAREKKSADYLAAILNSVGTPIWVLDSKHKIVMLNEAFSRFVGRAAALLVGGHESEAFDPASSRDRECRYREVLGGAPTSEAITEIRDGGGQQRTVIQLSSKLIDAAGKAQIVNVLTDITERQKAERRLAYVANYDLLTGLPNRGQFGRMLEEMLAGAAQRNSCVGVLVVSLERVQEVSDLLGHAAGDEALTQIGDVFRALLPGAAAVSRTKSNEFAVVIEAAKGRDFLEQYAIELHRKLSGALKVAGREFYLGPVIGVSIYPEDGDSADELFQRADSALNRTGVDIDDTIRFYSERAQTDLDERLMVEAQLRRALERHEFHLLYQPKVHSVTGRIVGFEALLRWINPVLGELPPGRFIAIAERTGLIIPIGAWALQEACRQLQAWNQAGVDVKLAVNLSPRQFSQKDLLPMIRQWVERCAVPPGSLELEITENALMSREQEVDSLMREIRALGVELSIDDFGTGYSSLAYLKRFPVQRLKVDRAFIRDLGKDADSAAIVRSIVNLAHGLKLGVVAEGVETSEQLAILRGMACDEYQGFLFSRPIDAGAALALFAQNRLALA